MTDSANDTTDFNQLNNALSQAIVDGGRLDDLLADLDCDVGKGPRNGKYRLPCPVHGGDLPSMQIEVGGWHLPVRWSCFSQQCHEQYKPSLLGLVRGILTYQADGKKARMRDAVEFMARYAGGAPLDAGGRPAPKTALLDLTRREVRARLDIPSRSFLDRGFSPEVLDQFDVGYSKKSRRDVVPLYDDGGQVCVGFEARSVLPRCESCKKHHTAGSDCKYGQSKWMGMKGFPKATYLYNYARAATTKAPFVFLVEGAPDVLRLADAGYVAVALLGSDASDDQLKKLAALGREVWIALDNDEAGEAARVRLDTRLLRPEFGFRRESFWAPAPFKDVGETPVDVLRRAVQERVEELAAADARYADPDFDDVAWYEPEEGLERAERRLREHREWLVTSTTGCPA
jgi:5S rRNA maturation endonuclease (ribonuclease M5)